MIRAKWLYIIVCACLLLSPQSVISAKPAPAPHELDRLRRMITEGPAQFYQSQDEPAPVFDALPPSNAVTPPAWARVAYQTYLNNQWDIYLSKPNGAGQVRLTSDGASGVYPSLARGGNRVAFASNRNGNYDIFGVNADGSGLTTLAESPATDTYPVWSPDAGRIAFQSNRSGNYEVYVMNANGSNPVQLTNSSAYDGEPTWSPDGSQIAFVSNRSGMYEIWLMNADGSNLRQLTSYSTTATPAWSPRGDKIVYANDRNQSGYYQLWMINVDGSAPKALREYSYPAAQHHDDWAPSWSPDGNSVEYIRTQWSYSYPGWEASYIYRVDPYTTAELAGPIGDNRSMRVSMASTDITPPAPCAVTLAPYQNSDSFLVTGSASDAESGAAFYNFQSRRLPDGAWQDFLVGAPQSGGVFAGVSGDRFEFRCQARDFSRNLGDWSTPPFAATEIRSLRPTSTVAVSQRYVKGNRVNLRWAGNGLAGQALRYDLFVRDRAGGDWTLWLEGVTTTAAQFEGTVGHTYDFRSQAQDALQHTQVWQPDPQATVTFYPVSLSVRSTDSRGNLLAAPGVALNPAAVVAEATRNFGEKRLGVNAAPLSISVTQPGYGSIPTTLLNVYQDRTVTFVMPPANNLVSNGGFEGSPLSGWTLSGDGVTLSGDGTAPLNGTFHSGHSSAKIAPGTTGSSEFSQVVTIGAALQKPTLSFLYYFPNNAGGGTLTVEVDGAALQTVLTTATVTDDWTHVWADLSALSGRTVTLRFRFSGSNAAAYIDEISLGSWTRPVVLHSQSMYVPIAVKAESALSVPAPAPASDWLTLGKDEQHSGFVANEPGSARFSQIWTVNPFTYNAASNFVMRVVSADGVVVISKGNEGSSSASIAAYDASSGRLLWSRLADSVKFGPASIAHGKVYYSGRYLFYCVDLYSGEMIWQSTLMDIWNQNQIQVFDQNLYIYGDYGSQAILNAASGGVVTSIPFAKYPDELLVYAAGIPAYAGGKMYTWINGIFSERNLSDGKVVWDLALAWNQPGSYSAPVISNRTAIVVSAGGLHAIDLDTHLARWTVYGNYGSALPAVDKDLVYAINGSTLEARQLSNGALTASFISQTPLINSPIVTGAYVYVSSGTQTYVLRRANLQIEQTIPESGWLALANGYLFIARSDGYVSAYRAQER